MEDETNIERQEALPNQRCTVAPEVKASNKQNLEVLHLISTASVDRAGDIVEPGGAQVDNYMRNPVVMRDHSYKTEDIIGKAVSIEITKEGIWARTKFRNNDVGQDAYKLAAEGLGGWSIGFRPVEYEGMKDDKGMHRGFRFKTWELLEYSQVAIPMNQDAVNNAIQRGLVRPENVSKFFTVTDSPQEPAEPTDTVAAPEPKAEPEPAPNQDKYPILADLLGAACEQIGASKREQLAREAVQERLRQH